MAAAAVLPTRPSTPSILELSHSLSLQSLDAEHIVPASDLRQQKHHAYGVSVIARDYASFTPSAIRKQRQRALRNQCTNGHRRAIEALLERMSSRVKQKDTNMTDASGESPVKMPRNQRPRSMSASCTSEARSNVENMDCGQEAGDSAGAITCRKSLDVDHTPMTSSFYGRESNFSATSLYFSGHDPNQYDASEEGKYVMRCPRSKIPHPAQG